MSTEKKVRINETKNTIETITEWWEGKTLHCMHEVKYKKEDPKFIKDLKNKINTIKATFRVYKHFI